MGTGGRRFIGTVLVDTDLSASLFLLLVLFRFLKSQND